MAVSRHNAVIAPKQLRAARALAGVTQTELAKLCGISRNVIVAMERSRRIRSAEIYEALRSGLSHAGVVLIDDEELSRDGGPGVRLK